jgi:hypothetical protein
MSALDPQLQSRCLLLLSLVREKTGCVLMPSTCDFFDGWRPELPRHKKNDYVLPAIRKLAPEHGFKTSAIRRFYDLNLVLPAVAYVEKDWPFTEAYRGGYGLPPRSRPEGRRVICLHDVRSGDQDPPRLGVIEGDEDQSDRTYRAFASADLFFRLLSEGVKPHWCHRLTRRSSGLTVGLKIDHAARPTLERFGRCDTSALGDEKIPVVPIIPSLTSKSSDCDRGTLVFRYELCAPGKAK